MSSEEDVPDETEEDDETDELVTSESAENELVSPPPPPPPAPPPIPWGNLFRVRPSAKSTPTTVKPPEPPKVRPPRKPTVWVTREPPPPREEPPKPVYEPVEPPTILKKSRRRGGQIQTEKLEFQEAFRVTLKEHDAAVKEMLADNEKARNEGGKLHRSMSFFWRKKLGFPV